MEPLILREMHKVSNWAVLDHLKFSAYPKTSNGPSAANGLSRWPPTMVPVAGPHWDRRPPRQGGCHEALIPIAHFTGSQPKANPSTSQKGTQSKPASGSWAKACATAAGSVHNAARGHPCVNPTHVDAYTQAFAQGHRGGPLH